MRFCIKVYWLANNAAEKKLFNRSSRTCRRRRKANRIFQILQRFQDRSCERKYDRKMWLKIHNLSPMSYRCGTQKSKNVDANSCKKKKKKMVLKYVCNALHGSHFSFHCSPSQTERFYYFLVESSQTLWPVLLLLIVHLQ